MRVGATPPCHVSYPRQSGEWLEAKLSRDVALINAPVRLRSEHARLSPPLGLAYLGAALRLANFTVEAIDFNVSGLNLRRVDAMVARSPRIVGIASTTETFPQALDIAARVKEIAPETVVVFGGAHPTILPEESLSYDTVDYVVVGAGEGAMVDLANLLIRGEGSASDIAGLAYRGADGAVVRNARSPLPHPDDLPSPSRDLFPTDFYQDSWNVLTATGSCPYRCPFCSASSLWEGRRRTRSVGSIVAEVSDLRARYGVERVFFTDDLFTMNGPWVTDLCEALRAMDAPVNWGCATRVDLVTPELIADMASAGCDGIQFGVESGAQTVLDSVKGIERGQVIEAVEAAIAAGIDAVCSFMAPFPQDTRETLAESFGLMRELYEMGARIYLSYTCPFPGTEFYDRADELGIKMLSTDWRDFDTKHVLFETPNLTAGEITETVEAMAAALGMRRSEV